jgi:hypothetical protein
MIRRMSNIEMRIEDFIERDFPFIELNEKEQGGKIVHSRRTKYFFHSADSYSGRVSNISFLFIFFCCLF